MTLTVKEYADRERVELEHSCCPGKVDINAPKFALTNSFQVNGATVREYECRGCRTVVRLIERGDESR